LKTLGSISLSKSFLFRRWIHDRLPTDDMLQKSGMSFASVCYHCGMESALHLFLQCPFAVDIWNWFSPLTNKPLDLSSARLLSSTTIGASPQIGDAFASLTIHITWFTCSRNHSRFQTGGFSFQFVRLVFCNMYFVCFIINVLLTLFLPL